MPRNCAFGGFLWYRLRTRLKLWTRWKYISCKERVSRDEIHRQQGIQTTILTQAPLTRRSIYCHHGKMSIRNYPPLLRKIQYTSLIPGLVSASYSRHVVRMRTLRQRGKPFHLNICFLCSLELSFTLLSLLEGVWGELLFLVHRNRPSTLPSI